MNKINKIWQLIERENGEIVLLGQSAERLYVGRDYSEAIKVLSRDINGQ